VSIRIRDDVARQQGGKRARTNVPWRVQQPPLQPLHDKIVLLIVVLGHVSGNKYVEVPHGHAAHKCASKKQAERLRDRLLLCIP